MDAIPSGLPRRRVAILGLPAVGKSTFVQAMHGKALELVQPTSGCNKSSVHREEVVLDLLDLGGSPQVRKFWGQMVSEAHAIVVFANAAEADDMSWAVLAGEVSRLRAGRPLLVLLNQRDVAAKSCVPASEALDRLNIDPAPDVRCATIARSSDVAAAESGLAWLSNVMLGGEAFEEAADEEEPLWSAAAAALDEHQARGGLGFPPAEDDVAAATRGSDAPRPVGRSRLRVLQAVEDARQFSEGSDDGALAAALAAKLASGHLLSSEEIAKLRQAQAPP